MKNIDGYIIEKLHLNKDIKSKVDLDDPSGWQVGDILVGQCGYSMTIVDFYEIVSITASHKTFVLKHVKDKIVSGNGMQGTSVPDEGHYEDNGKEIKVRVNKNNRVKTDNTYLSLWSGEPVYFDHMD